MGKFQYFTFIIIVVLFSTCKKDLLHFRQVIKINSYTDSDRLNKILFVNDSIGFIAGGKRFDDAVILTTRNGGYTWSMQNPPEVKKGLYDMVISHSGAVFACGFDGKLLYSNDTGRNWVFHQYEYFAFTGIAFTDAAHAIMVGGVSFSSGIMEYIDTAGHLIKRDSFSFQLNKIQMVSPQVGYICGYGIMEKTTDGGKSWTFQDVIKDNFTAMDIHGDEIWMCGFNGGIYHTANGGSSWKRLRNGNDITLPRYHLYAIRFKDSQHGWAGGEEGKLIYTDDAGRHWSEYDHFTNSTIRDIALCPNGDLLAAGDNGVLFRIVPE